MMVRCPYCNSIGELRDSSYVYGGDDTNVLIYVCKNFPGCDSYGSKTLANKELRELRRYCHELFDSYWKSNGLPRSLGYKILSSKLGIKKRNCHIALFDVGLCNKLINIFKRRDDG